MKQSSVFALVLFALMYYSSGVRAQSVGINGSGAAADPSAILDLNSTTMPAKGVLLTRLTTAQRDAINSPAQALTIYNLTTKCFEFYENQQWQTLICATCPINQPGSISGTSPLCQGTNGTTFSVANVPGVTYSWTYSGAGFTCTSGCTTNSITANFSGSATTGTLSCTPSISCGAGPASTFAISINALPTTANAGADQLNISGTSTTLAGNSASSGIGSWSIISGAGGNVTSPSNPTSTFTGIASTSYVLRWTIANAPCSSSFDEVTVSFAAAPTCIIGSAMQGGVAFLDSGGKCYIAFSGADNGAGVWGCPGLVGAGAQGQAIGTGQANTTAASGCAAFGSAINVCDNLVSAGYSDWYLPSVNELAQVYAQRTAIGGFGTDFYWSSSEIDAPKAWGVWFYNGISYNLYDKSTNYYKVRCIRSF